MALDALSLAQRVLALIETGRKSATYKLATLTAIIDVVAEDTDSTTGLPPDIISARDVGRRVVELYWPQTAVYTTDASHEPRVLRQSAHNDIPAKLAHWRSRHSLASDASFASARLADPAGWDALERQLIATVIGMPLAKLQRFGDSREAREDRFIYDFAWRDEVKQSTIERDTFDDRLHLRPGVAASLVQLAPLLRPALQSKWIEMVCRSNTDLLEEHQLNEFLFGARRISLDRIRAPLHDVQRGRCFYCDRTMRNAEVDHFLPWSRRPDNALDNLVAAHPDCNGAKSASIAATAHLEHWVHRVTDDTLDAIVRDVGWPRNRVRTIGAVTATYLWLPDDTPLWISAKTFELVDSGRIQRLLRTLDPSA